MTADLGQTPPEPKSTNPFQRLVGVIVSPTETMNSIAIKPDWIIPLLLIIVLSVVANVLVAPHVDIEPQIRAQAEKQDLSDEQIDQQLEVVAKVQKFQAVITAVFVPIVLVIVAAILLLAIKVFGGEGGFKHVLSVTAYGWVPQIIKAVIGTVIITQKGMIDSRVLPNVLKSHLGFLSDPVQSPIPFSLLSSLDVFTFWSIFLIVVGLAATSKFSRGKVAALVIPLWLVVVAVKVGFAALGS